MKSEGTINREFKGTLGTPEVESSLQYPADLMAEPGSFAAGLQAFDRFALC